MLEDNVHGDGNQSIRRVGTIAKGGIPSFARKGDFIAVDGIRNSRIKTIKNYVDLQPPREEATQQGVHRSFYHNM